MQLPDGFENRRFSDWNCLVRGLLEVWEIARARGKEKALEEHIERDRDGSLTEILGRLGYACATASALRQNVMPMPEGASREADDGEDRSHKRVLGGSPRPVRPVFAIVTGEPVRRAGGRTLPSRRFVVERHPREEGEGDPV